MTDKLYDLFITHAWRYHDDWTRMGEMLDAHPGLKWRNFSVPWHDPAMDPNTEVGGKFIRNWLELQITPVTGVLLLNSVYETKSARKWIDFEIEMARKHGKPVIAIPTFGTSDVLQEVQQMSDIVAEWDGDSVINSIDALASRNQST